MIRLILIAVASFVLSCSDTDEQTLCFGFDIRSCAGDPWLSEETTSDEATLNSRTTQYLNDQGLEVNKVSIDMGFHEVVCLACVVCPQGPRVFVEINSQDSTVISSLSLLNLELSDCSNID